MPEDRSEFCYYQGETLMIVAILPGMVTPLKHNNGPEAETSQDALWHLCWGLTSKSSNISAKLGMIHACNAMILEVKEGT